MAAFLSPSRQPGENMGLHFRATRAALPQIRVDTLIGSQADFVIKIKNNDILLQDNDII